MGTIPPHEFSRHPRQPFGWTGLQPTASVVSATEGNFEADSLVPSNASPPTSAPVAMHRSATAAANVGSSACTCFPDPPRMRRRLLAWTPPASDFAPPPSPKVRMPTHDSLEDAIAEFEAEHGPIPRSKPHRRSTPISAAGRRGPYSLWPAWTLSSEPSHDAAIYPCAFPTGRSVFWALR